MVDLRRRRLERLLHEVEMVLVRRADEVIHLSRGLGLLQGLALRHVQIQVLLQEKELVAVAARAAANLDVARALAAVSRTVDVKLDDGVELARLLEHL